MISELGEEQRVSHDSHPARCGLLPPVVCVSVCKTCLLWEKHNIQGFFSVKYNGIKVS